MINNMRFNTALLHSAAPGDKATGATLTPIYQSSAFYQESALQHEKLFANKAPGFSYTRIGNPTITAFEDRMTVLEVVWHRWRVHPVWQQCHVLY